MKTEILIVGSGCSGLYCALKLPKDKQVTIITKSDLKSNDSYLAQGGMCILKDEYDYDSFFEDTLQAGHYENDRESVEIMIRSSQSVLADLLRYGVEFAREADGSLAFTKEGAHSEKRIVFHEDVTGKEITSRLLAAVQRRENIVLKENTTLLDIIEENNTCYGAVIQNPDGSLETVECNYTILATGGVGGLFSRSTNYKHLSGDALAIAIKHNILLKNISYIQIHPTTLYDPKSSDRCFLLSESLRGEGAKLYDKNMNRFVDELLPRDLLTMEIEKQMEKDGTDFVWEDLRPIPKEELLSHFPNIVSHCREKGYDVFTECIPVVPAQHYFMGGIWVDHQSKTSMQQLYAIGETACTGVHGSNRLASNSLLESLVFAKRAADEICLQYPSSQTNPLLIADVNLSQYEDIQALKEEYRALVLEEIKKDKKREKETIHV